MAWPHILLVVFFWSDRPIPSEKRVAKCSSMTKHNLSFTHSFQKNNIQWSTQVVQHTIQPHKCFSSRQSSYFNLQHFSYFVLRIVFKINKCWDLIEIILLLHQGHSWVKRTCFVLFYCQCTVWRIQWWLIQLQLLLDLCSVATVLPSIDFAPSWLMSI